MPTACRAHGCLGSPVQIPEELQHLNVLVCEKHIDHLLWYRNWLLAEDLAYDSEKYIDHLVLREMQALAYPIPGARNLRLMDGNGEEPKTDDERAPRRRRDGTDPP